MQISKVILVFLLVFTFSSVFAQGDPDDLLFKIAVFGPADELFGWWGHAALVVENTRWNFARSYDWGINSHPNESFIMDSINGEVQYRVAVFSHRVDIYVEEDRDIVIYTLNLDRRAKEIILSYVENLVKPENCYYEYHEFLDNCSTGVRDAIDLGTGGQFRAFFEVIPGRFSYRQHVLRYSWFRPFPDWLLSFLMGQNLDERITAWDEMFLPVEIGRNIVDFSYIDHSGAERNLVSSIEMIHASKSRLPVLNKPLVTWPLYLAVSLLIMILLFLFDAMRNKFPAFSRVLLGISHCFFGLLLGGLGYVLVIGLSMNTDYVKDNINVLFINPLLLILFPLGILSAINEKLYVNPDKVICIVWNYVFIIGSITLLLRVLPFFYQQNLSVYALVLPIAFALGNIPKSFIRFKNFLLQAHQRHRK